MCGTASYRKLTHRGPDGAMQYSGLFRCSGCSGTFSDPVAWREGEPAATVPIAAGSVELSYAARDGGHDFSTGHILLPRMPGVPLGYGDSEADLKEIQEAAERANRSKGRRR